MDLQGKNHSYNKRYLNTGEFLCLRFAMLRNETNEQVCQKESFGYTTAQALN